LVESRHPLASNSYNHIPPLGVGEWGLSEPREMVDDGTVTHLWQQGNERERAPRARGRERAWTDAHERPATGGWFHASREPQFATLFWPANGQELRTVNRKPLTIQWERRERIRGTHGSRWRRCRRSRSFPAFYLRSSTRSQFLGLAGSA